MLPEVIWTNSCACLGSLLGLGASSLSEHLSVVLDEVLRMKASLPNTSGGTGSSLGRLDSFLFGAFIL